MALYTLSPIIENAYQLGVEGCARLFNKSYHLSTLIDYLILTLPTSIKTKKAIYDNVRRVGEFVTDDDQLVTIPTFVQHEDPAVVILKVAYEKLEEIRRNLMRRAEKIQEYDQPTAVVAKEEWLWRAKLTLLAKVYEILGVKKTKNAEGKKGFYIDLPTQWDMEELIKFCEPCTLSVHSIESDLPGRVLSFVEELPPGYVEVEPYPEPEIQPTLRSLMIIDTNQLFRLIMNAVETIIEDPTDIVIDLKNRKIEAFSNKKYDLTSYLI